MRNARNVLALLCGTTLAACGGVQVTNQTVQYKPQNSATPTSQVSGTPASESNQSTQLEVTPAHGTMKNGNSVATDGASAPGKAPVATPELDTKIDKALKKAKASGATASDRKAAADAYLARGNFYWSAGDVRLYRFALGDFRRVLRYDPANTDAQAKIDELVRIYHQLGKPVPDIGNEP